VTTIQNILEKEPKNSEARTLLAVAEDKLIKRMYTAVVARCGAESAYFRS